MADKQPKPVVPEVVAEPTEPKVSTEQKPRSGRFHIPNPIRRIGRGVRSLSRSGWLFLLILVAVAGDQVALFEKPLLGAYVNAAAFTVLLMVALWNTRVRSLCLSAAVIPAAFMISLSLPQTTNFLQIVVLYNGLLILGLIYRFIFAIDTPLSYSKLSLKGYGINLPLMIVVGEALGVIGYVLLRHQYGYRPTGLPLVAAAAVVFAISEEVVFRGLVQQQASKILHPVMAAVLSALLSASLAIGHTGSYLAPLFALLASSVIAFIYYKKQNLLLTITVNATTKLVYVGLLASFIFR